jgi:hypothetical protein
MIGFIAGLAGAGGVAKRSAGATCGDLTSYSRVERRMMLTPLASGVGG